MRHFKTIIGVILIGITMCGCQYESNTVSSEIAVNGSEKEVIVLDSGVVSIDENPLHSLIFYDDAVELREFKPTHAVYIRMVGHSYSGPLIGPNGYNCLYNEEGYIYESVTNVIVYDFR